MSFYFININSTKLFAKMSLPNLLLFRIASSAGILSDKTMADKLMQIPNDDT